MWLYSYEKAELGEESWTYLEQDAIFSDQ